MTIREPFEFVPNPPLSGGEKLISVADPIESAPGSSTYYLSRRFNFVGGDYSIELRADDAATMWIGTSQFNSRMIASSVGDIGNAFVNIADGQYRIDIILQNVPPQPSPCFFSLLIKSGGRVVYASSKDGWYLDDAPISDQDLPEGRDPRFDLPVFTVLPNWSEGILERLSWLTDVMASERGAEQRRSVRRNARRTFEASFLRQFAQRDRLDTFFVGIGATKFMLPLWHEGVKLRDGLDMGAAGVTFDDGEFLLREFRKGDLVFVNAGDPDNYDVLQVGDTEQNRFSWEIPPPRRWPPGTHIYPMRTARIVETLPQMANISDAKSTASVRFEQIEPYSVPEAWGGSFAGEPLWRFIPNRVEPVNVQYGHKAFTLDNNSGVPITTDHGRYTTANVTMRLTLISRAKAYAFRQFLQAARGMARHFYMPTFMQDIELDGPIAEGSADIRIQNQGFYDYMLRPQPIRLRLSFQFRNGTQTLYRTIENVQPLYKLNPNGEAAFPLQVVAELLTLDSPLPAMTQAQLKRISFLCETRFDQDNFEIRHPTNTQAVIETSLTFKQMLNQRELP